MRFVQTVGFLLPVLAIPLFSSAEIGIHNPLEPGGGVPGCATVTACLQNVIRALLSVAGFIALPTLGRALGLPGGLGEFLYFEHPEPYHFDPAIALISTVAGLAGLAVAAAFHWTRTFSPLALRQRYGWLHDLLVRKLYLDDLYQGVIDRVVLAGGAFIAWFDRAVVNDVGVNGTGAAAVVAGDKLKYAETGRLPNYALTMALGLLVIAALVFTFL
jgi:NADH-quinone oxidoreductase subunit L